jgi:hypothetical protein
MAKMARDALRAIAPENDSLVCVDDDHTGGKAFENASADIGIVETGHGKCARNCPLLPVFIGKIHKGFRVRR